MAFSRYVNDPRQSGGNALGIAQSVVVLRNAIAQRTISISKSFTTTGFDRLDNLAGAIYGDATYWWILAAASNVGWGLQVPPGTIINVVDLNSVQRLVG